MDFGGVAFPSIWSRGSTSTLLLVSSSIFRCSDNVRTMADVRTNPTSCGKKLANGPTLPAPRIVWSWQILSSESVALVQKSILVTFLTWYWLCKIWKCTGYRVIAWEVRNRVQSRVSVVRSRISHSHQSLQYIWSHCSMSTLLLVSSSFFRCSDNVRTFADVRTLSEHC